ncbi:hypothetical protein FACS1894156_6020 [Bacteroidia bacterium]|nr:hypothetical protein FACS1894156_6020 [Bacteroidia bacterium]
MNFKYIFLGVIAAAMLAASCAKQPKDISSAEWEQEVIAAYLSENNHDASTLTQLEGGGYVLLHNTEKRTGTASPQTSDYVKFDAVVKTLKGAKLQVTKKWDAQLLGTFANSTHYLPTYDSLPSLLLGVQRALSQMQEGDSMIVLLPSSLAYGTSGSSSISGYTPLIFEIMLRQIITDPRKAEANDVADFLTAHTEFVPLLDSIGEPLAGIYIHYVDTVAVIADSITYPVKDTKMGLKYAGFFLDDFLLDTNIEDTAANHKLNLYDSNGAKQSKYSSNFEHTYGYGATNSIGAFDAALRRVTQGSTVEFVFTSEWGYGKIGTTTTVQPYTPLHFRVYRDK